MDLKEEIKQFLISKGVVHPSDEVMNYFHDFLQQKIKESSKRLAKVLIDEFGVPERE
ncbi:hypothetical protein [Brevibacillus gelatini]|uniref:hypothetical protein n=1 Tax=Brevibacillus gelatini TaxID=1655277 RepID=UPI001476066B|nr:hypothetical protein [Brevibacillus gelatini]